MFSPFGYARDKRSGPTRKRDAMPRSFAVAQGLRRRELMAMAPAALMAAGWAPSSAIGEMVRKTREIGLLSALGAKAHEVALCFCVQAFIIGVTGTAIGVGAGFGVIAIRQHIVDGITNLLQRQETLRQFYQFRQYRKFPVLYVRLHSQLPEEALR